MIGGTGETTGIFMEIGRKEGDLNLRISLVTIHNCLARLYLGLYLLIMKKV